jgi:hypothetical protein
MIRFSSIDVRWALVLPLGLASGCVPLGDGFVVRVGELELASGDPVSILDVPFGYSSQAYLQLANRGDGVLSLACLWRDEAVSGGFLVSPSVAVLDADETLAVEVTYFAGTFALQEAILDITHDGLGESLVIAVFASTDEDADDDGFVHEENGGGDCNDRNATVYPGATELWYDGTDQDCDGWSDYDADFDGYDREIYGGDDCDDADSEIHPGAIDMLGDGIDQDCDGVD